MATIEITDHQLFRLSQANQRLHEAAGNGSITETEAAAREVVTLVNVLVLPEHLNAG